MITGEFANAVIRGFEKAEELSQQNNPLAEFSAMFSPENFSILNSFNFDSAQSDGETGSEHKFRNVGPRDFNFDFEIDATGAADEILDVKEQIDKFKAATGFKRLGGFTSNERRPTFLSVSWGTFSVRCVLKDMEVDYTLFDDDGKPLRATIKAKFSEYKTLLRQIRENPAFEQVATQIRSAVDLENAGKRLDTLAHEVYGNVNSLVDMAKANGVNTLRDLSGLGDLELPPIDNLKEQGLNMAKDLAQKKLEQATALADEALSAGLEDVGGAISDGLSSLF
ncbi:MAG: hypothetical protein MRZ79_21735 [Bacteroidia bacterium]|nr:hypothetical protein [Bacteroidia bacterium]